jgi:hypothetical protein
MDIKNFFKFLFCAPLIPILGIIMSDEAGEEGDSDNSDTDSPEEQPEEGENTETDGEEEEPEAEEQDEPESEGEDTVPLATYLETKNKLKEERRKNAEYEDSKLSDNVRKKKESIKNMFIKKGYSEEAANDMADFGAEFLEEMSRTQTTNTEKLIEEEIQELAKDDFYSGIENHTSEIKSTISKAKNAGLNMTVEQAYLMQFGSKRKLKEAIRKEEVIEASRKDKPKTPTVPTASNTKKSNTYKLDEYDRKALKMLQESQPDFKWTEKKYFDDVKNR